MLKLDLHDSASLMRAGLIPGIHIEDYHKGPGISSTRLKRASRSAAHFMFERDKESKAKAFGRVFHPAILEPETVDLLVAPNINKNTNEYKAWKAAHAGREIVTEAEKEILTGMAASVAAHPSASKLLFQGDGINEHSGWWIDEESGELCRCRPDRYRRDLGIIIDLKSAKDASKEGFARDAEKLGYFLSAAMYWDGVEAVTGDYVKGFVFVAVEKEFPFAVGVYAYDLRSIEAGRTKYKRLLMEIADCKHAGKWPAYSDEIETISLKDWTLKEIYSDEYE
jgi:hypothetical protein